jgi:hypothetical protein
MELVPLEALHLESGRWGKWGEGYPLVMNNIAMENHHF